MKKEKLDIQQDFAIRNLFNGFEKTFKDEKTSVVGLRTSLELIGNGEIVEKEEYDYKGDRLMYKEHSADNTKILVVHGAYAKSPYGGELGYRYEIGVYSNNPRTSQIGGGYGTSGIIETEYPNLFKGDDSSSIYYNENLVSKVCEVVKNYFDFSTEIKQDDNYALGGSIKPSTDDVIFSTDRYEFIRSKHTKTDATIYMLKLKSRVSREDYKTIESAVKLIKGYYSSYVTAFILKSEISQSEVEHLLDGTELEFSKNTELPEQKISDDHKINEAGKEVVEKLVEKGMDEEKALATVKKGISEEEEHKPTLEKIASGELTPEQGIAEIVHDHEKSNAGKLPLVISYAIVKPIREGAEEKTVRVSPDSVGGFVAGYVIYYPAKSNNKVAYFNKLEMHNLIENGEYKLFKTLDEAEKYDSKKDELFDVYFKAWDWSVNDIKEFSEIYSIPYGGVWAESDDDGKIHFENLTKEQVELLREMNEKENHALFFVNEAGYHSKSGMIDNSKNNHRVFIVHKDGSPNTEFENISEEEAGELYEKYLLEPNSEIVTWDKVMYNKYGHIESRPTIKMQVIKNEDEEKELKKQEELAQITKIEELIEFLQEVLLDNPTDSITIEKLELLKETLSDLKINVEKFAKGGSVDCGCNHKYADGGAIGEDGFKRLMKKDGYADVTFLNPVIVTDLNYFKPYSNLKELKSKVRDYLIENFRGAKILNKQTGHEILITRISIDKLLYSAGEYRLKLLLHLPEIIENATPHSVQEIVKKNVSFKKLAKFVYIFESFIKIEDKIYEFGFTTFVMGENDAYIYSGYLDVKNPV